MICPCRRVSFLLLVVGLGVAAGCGESVAPQSPPTVNDQDLMRLVSVYTTYKSKHQGKAPASTEELVKWVKSLKPEERTQMGIEDVDKAFTSPRDNQLYQVAPQGTDMASKMGGGIIFYEKEGVNGKHKVISGMGSRPAEIDREELKQRVPGFKG